MKLSFALLCLYPLIQACYSATPCGTLPPGMDRLSHGIDITSFDLLPLDLQAANGYARTIFDFTCDKKKRWQNPFVPTLVYDLPDQIESVTSLPGGIAEHKQKFMGTDQDHQKDSSFEAGVGFKEGMFSLSGTSKRARDNIDIRNRTGQSVSAVVSAIQVELEPYFAEQAGQYMMQFYNQFLPNNYAENPGKYQEFLSLFGTHYFQTAKFGGIMKIDMYTTNAYASRNTQKNMEIQAEAKFNDVLNAHGKHTSNKANTDKDFNDNTVTEEHYYGGNADLMKPGLAGFDGWWNSAQQNPWLFSGKLGPITDFLPAGLKKNAIATAINVKLDYAYLDGLMDSLNVLKQNPYIDMATANSLANQVVALRGQVVPAHPSVVALGNAINGFVNVQKTRGPPAPAKPACQVVYDKKAKKNVCVNPATCICKIYL